MKFRQVGGNRKFISYMKDNKLLHEKGDILIEGKYIGRTPTEDNYGHHGFDFYTGPNDPTVTLSYAGSLQYIMENYVNEGDNCQVVYDGQEKLSKGKYKGKMSHQFKVFIEDDLSEEGEVEAATEEAPKKKAVKKEAKKKVESASSVDLSSLD